MDFKTNPPKMASIIPTPKKPNTNPRITSLSFHKNGKYLYTATSSNRIRMIDCLSNNINNPNGITLNKHGANIVEATHHEYSVLVSGIPTTTTTTTTNEYVINYVSLHDNKILRTFHGHTNIITNISMCPIDDRFLSSSRDGTIRLWMLNNAGCLAKMDTVAINNTFSTPYGIFDSTGLVFGILSSVSSSSSNNTIQKHHIHLYDSRNYSSGAFSEFVIPTATLSKYLQTHKPSTKPNTLKELCDQSWVRMTFNTDGSEILITSHHNNIYWILDGYDGTIKQCLLYPNISTTKNKEVHTLHRAVYTQDDKYVVSMHPNGQVYVWDVSVGACVHVIENMDVLNGGGLAINPKYAMMCTASVDTMLWLW